MIPSLEGDGPGEGFDDIRFGSRLIMDYFPLVDEGETGNIAEILPIIYELIDKHRKSLFCFASYYIIDNTA